MIDLTVCNRCGLDFVYPVEWHEINATHWHVLTRCGNCGSWKAGNYDNRTVDAFDTRLEDGIDVITDQLHVMLRENLASEIEEFVEALACDAILPEDF